MTFRPKRSYTKEGDKVHRELQKFSKASWQELEDIWPKELRVSSEAYMLLAVALPAWRALTLKYKFEESGHRFSLRDLLLLFWVHRCEEAKDNVATEGYPISKQMSWNKRMRSVRQGVLHHLKLVENMPYRKLQLYRVTAKGKMVMRDYVEMIEQAHKDIRHFANIQPEENAEKINKALQTYFSQGGSFYNP